MSNLIDFDKGIFALAPLAGFTDLPFCSVVKKFGADLTFSEMLSANALVYNSKKTFKMLEKSPNEIPYIVQIAGSDLKVIKEAVEILNDIEGIDGIDLNSGCPVPKVVSQNSGSSLLLNLTHFREIIQPIKKYSNKQYTTAKIRIGIDKKIPLDIAKTIEDCEIDMIFVHGRTKKDGYKAPVDYDAIKIIKENVKIPIIANGDINNYEKAKQVLNYTKANGIMIGRAAIGKPWIFYQISTGQKNISQKLKKKIILEHLDSMIEHYKEHGIIMFRKHLHTYSKGYNNANFFRESNSKS